MHQTKNGRWIYYAERNLSTSEVRFVHSGFFLPLYRILSHPHLFSKKKRKKKTSAQRAADTWAGVETKNSKWIAELDKRNKAEARTGTAAGGGGGGGGGAQS